MKPVSLYCYLLLSILMVGCINSVQAQSSSLISDGAQDYIRRQQLMGKVDMQEGMMVRSFIRNAHALDSLVPGWLGTGKKLTGEIKSEWLPFSAGVQFNAKHPYGWNDGAMIPARGIQTIISGGVALYAGKFSLQLKPEFVFAGNPEFETFPAEHYNNYWADYYRQVNRIDLPERFGSKGYVKLFPGQSSIRYTSGAISAGISTENLWWGPGKHNALVMSNNAPGFVHVTVNTVKPIQTRIGSFEGQFIAGILRSSGIFPLDTNRYYNGVRIYQAKKEESRYMTGLTVSWQPIWVKGLFLGFTRASYQYQNDISGLADIFPLQGIIRSATEKNGHKGALGSVFARYIMPTEHAELYFEFGRNDKAATPLNIVADNAYPRAYVAGFSKLFAARKAGRFIEFAAEFTQLELPTADLIKQAVSWYTHPYVRQGFTNNGQVLGAGIGPGSNSLQLDLSLVNGYNKVGIQIERIARNEDFYYNAFVITNDVTRHWIDISTTFHADLRVKKNLIATAQLGIIRSLNYQWFILPDLGYFKNGYDVLNIHANIALTYRL